MTEIIVSLAIVAVLSALVAPFLFRSSDVAKVEETGRRLRAIHRAIVGEPAEKTFGFLGDLGRLPGSLTQLIQRGSLPAFTTATTNGVGMGWNGPYFAVGFDTAALRADAWGTPLQYDSTTAQVTSAGADRDQATTGDNITFPGSPITTTTGTLVINVVVRGDPNPLNTTVTVFSTNNGVETSVSQTNTGGSFAGFTFLNVRQGLHAVRAVNGTFSKVINVPVRAGTQVQETIHLLGQTTLPPFDFGQFQDPYGDIINGGIRCLLELRPSIQSSLILNQIDIVVTKSEILSFDITRGATNDDIAVAASTLANESAKLLQQLTTGNEVPDNELRGTIDDCGRNVQVAANVIATQASQASPGPP